MPDLDDNTLLNRARGGDREALGQLLFSHERRLHHVCLRMVGHRDDAAELTQDALVHVIRGLDSFRGEAQLTTWMTRIAMNLCLSHLRKRKVRQTPGTGASGNASIHRGTSADPAGEIQDHREPSPDHRVQQQEAADELQAALDCLDADHRAVLVLRDVQQLDYAAISQVLDCAVGTVKSRLFRARLALREALTTPPSPPPSTPPPPPSRPIRTPPAPSAAS